MGHSLINRNALQFNLIYDIRGLEHFGTWHHWKWIIFRVVFFYYSTPWRVVFIIIQCNVAIECLMNLEQWHLRLKAEGGGVKCGDVRISFGFGCQLARLEKRSYKNVIFTPWRCASLHKISHSSTSHNNPLRFLESCCVHRSLSAASVSAFSLSGLARLPTSDRKSL